MIQAVYHVQLLRPPVGDPVRCSCFWEHGGMSREGHDPHPFPEPSLLSSLLHPILHEICALWGQVQLALPPALHSQQGPALGRV